jgi:hypothetical protein
MAEAGYSGTPLWKKLGINEKTRVLALHAPGGYAEWLDFPGELLKGGRKGEIDLVHLFAANNRIFEKEMIALKPLLAQNRQLVIWVSWYKKTSAMAADLTEDIIRNWALANELVDVKVCAINADWSGLKLVIPLAKR